MSATAPGPPAQPSILERIAAQRRIDVIAAASVVPAEALAARVKQYPPLDLHAALLRAYNADRAGQLCVAAEFKRASPSKGDIACGLVAGEQRVRLLDSPTCSLLPACAPARASSGWAQHGAPAV